VLRREYSPEHVQYLTQSNLQQTVVPVKNSIKIRAAVKA
jgi:hypothetical protein